MIGAYLVREVFDHDPLVARQRHSRLPNAVSTTTGTSGRFATTRTHKSRPLRPGELQVGEDDVHVVVLPLR